MWHFRSFRRFWALTTMVVLLQLIVVQAMAANGALHKRCHDHADDPGHQCAVTLMLQGGYHDVMPDINPVTILSSPPAEPVPLPQAGDVEPFHLVGGVLAHAPPRGP